MKGEKMVSVVIPTYNREDTIFNSVKSVLNQTYSDLEAIVVDDCSTDATKKEIEKIEDNRVRYIKCDNNLGVAAARNIGIKNAHGEFIAFNDSDDLWRENKLELQMEELEKHSEYGMVFCAFSRKKNQRLLYSIPSSSLPIEKLSGYIFDFLLTENVIGTPTMLIRKEVFDKIGKFGTQLRILDDYEFALRVANKYQIGYVNEILVDTYELEDSINALNEKSVYQIIEAYLNICKYWSDFGISEEKLKLLYFNAVDMLKYIDRKQISAYIDKFVPVYFASSEEMERFWYKEKMFLRYQFKDRVMAYIFSERAGSIANFFTGKNIAIYGNGYIGKCLYHILKKHQVVAKYVIDRVVKEENYKVVKLEDSLDDIDTIVLSVYDPIKKIEMEIQKQHPTVEIVYILNLINEIERQRSNLGETGA